MKFLESVYHSLFDIEWLRAKRDTGRWAAVGFLFVVTSVIGLLRVVPLLGFIAPKAVAVGEQKLKDDVPDFSLIMENGQLRTEKLPQPYVFTQTSGDETFTLVIDTISTSSPSVESLIKNKDTDIAFVLGHDQFSYFDPELKEVKSESYTDVPNGTLTKDQLVTWVEKFRTTYLVPIFVVLGGLFVLMFFVGRLISVALWSLVFLVLVKIKKWNWTYRELNTVGKYASTLPLLVSSVMFWFGISWPLATMVYVGMMYLVVNPEYKMKHEGV